MHKTILFSAVMLTAACSKKDDKGAANEKPTTGDTAKPAGTATPAGDTAKPAAEGKYTCDTVLKKEIRDKYFANHKIENIEFPVKHAGKCKITTPDGSMDFEIGAACASFMGNARTLTIDGIKKQFPQAKDLAVGDGGFVMPVGDDEVSFTVWSKGSFCQLDGSVPKTLDLNAFLNDWLATMPTS